MKLLSSEEKLFKDFAMYKLWDLLHEFQQIKCMWRETLSPLKKYVFPSAVLK